MPCQLRPWIITQSSLLSFLPVRPCAPGPSEHLIQHTPPTIQCIRLLPQHIRPKLPERRLNPGPRLGIPRHGPTRRVRPRQQARFAPQEQAARRKEEIRRDVAQRCRAQHGCYVGYGFCFAARDRRQYMRHLVLPTKVTWGRGIGAPDEFPRRDEKGGM